MREPETLRRELRRARIRLEAAIARVADADYDRPVAAGGWTVRDVLNHVAAWDEVGATTIQELGAGRSPTRYITDVDDFNADAVSVARTRSPADCLAAIRDARAAFGAALDAAPGERWAIATDAGLDGEVVSIASLCETWIRHDDEHAAELEVFLGNRPSEVAWR
jgi:uncharacterized protein (TIGR03083 family)